LSSPFSPLSAPPGALSSSPLDARGGDSSHSSGNDRWAASARAAGAARRFVLADRAEAGRASDSWLGADAAFALGLAIAEFLRAAAARVPGPASGTVLR
jgi:hypothetical protein